MAASIVLSLRALAKFFSHLIGIGVIIAVAISTAAFAQTQPSEFRKPRLSYSQGQFFKNNPGAFERFLSSRSQPLSGQVANSRSAPNPPLAGGTWQTVTTLAPSGSLVNPILLTDGTVIIQRADTQTWYRLTPDNTGSYVNGTWSSIAAMPSGYAPDAYASAVLPDGRVIIEGGEYNFGSLVWTNLGAIYDPSSNTWTSVAPPHGGSSASGWNEIGDSPSIILANGSFMLGACCANPSKNVLFNPTTLTWSDTGAPNEYQNEQGYTLLPDGRVLTINVWDLSCYPNCNANAAQAYSQGPGTWANVAAPPISLVDTYQCGTYEIGPAVTRADGTVVAFGGHTGCSAGGNQTDPTAVYTPSTDSWIQGPDVPTILAQNYDLADAPAALLPNGNILFAASPGYGNSPTHFFEFTTANAINQVADTVSFSSNRGAYNYSFLVLPSGQILAIDYTSTVEIYTPTGSPDPGWTPVISSVPSTLFPGQDFSLTGTQLNGLSQGAYFGDETQTSTNYPIVRITNNSSGHIFYARTFNHSSRSIAPGAAGSTQFGVPASIETGPSSLVVVANGIPSTPVSVTISSAGALNVTPASNATAAGYQGGAFVPSSFPYQLKATSGTVGYSISGVPGWLTASSTSGTATTAGTTVTFTVNSNANSLSPSTYAATITFSDTTNSTTVLTITATLNVGTSFVTPATNMSFSGTQGGPFSPSSFQFQISSPPETTYNYSVSNVPSWLFANPTSGGVTFTVNTPGYSLSPGTYNAVINFTNTTNGLGNTTRTATLTVNAGGGGGGSPSKVYVLPNGGFDSGVCTLTIPCATLNYALSVSGTGGQVILLGGGIFGPVVLTKEISIVGIDPKVTFQIVADPTAAVGCVGGTPGTCSANNGFAVEIAAGATDTVKVTNTEMLAGTNGAGALKFTSGGVLQLSENVYRGNDGATGPIVALYPNNPGTTQALVYFSHSDIGFNNINSSGAGAVEVRPTGNTSLKLHFNHVEVHNANYGIRTDSSLLSNSSIAIATAISESEFFSFANAAVNAFSIGGAGTTNAVFDAVRVLNANVAIKANGPQSTVILTDSTVSGNGIGVQVTNGGTIYTPQNNTITGNGVDLSGSLTSSPPR